MTQDFDYLFAKSKLPEGIINLGIGENHILREAVLEAYNLKNVSFENLPNIWEYAPPYGYEPLVERLEAIYDSKVVVTCGAKHALSAAFYAMYQTGKVNIKYQVPYWPSIPSLIARENLKTTAVRELIDFELIVAPGNPTGFSLHRHYIEKPVIHDAAYYTHSYLPQDYKLEKFGDLQIYSMAKMFGLSGCRIGWIVVNNPEYYDHLMKFVEATTAGISTPSQRVLMHVLDWDANNPELRKEYEKYVYTAISNNRKYLYENLNKKYFRFYTDCKDIVNTGMFAWVESKIQDFNLAGVNVMGGAAFGDPEFIRINLAISLDKIVKAVNKMNTYAEFHNKETYECE